MGHTARFESSAGRFVPLTRPTHLQRRYLKARQVPEPPRFEKIAATQVQLELMPSELFLSSNVHPDWTE